MPFAAAARSSWRTAGPSTTSASTPTGCPTWPTTSTSGAASRLCTSCRAHRWGGVGRGRRCGWGGGGGTVGYNLSVRVCCGDAWLGGCWKHIDAAPPLLSPHSPPFSCTTSAWTCMLGTPLCPVRIYIRTCISRTCLVRLYQPQHRPNQTLKPSAWACVWDARRNGSSRTL